MYMYHVDTVIKKLLLKIQSGITLIFRLIILVIMSKHVLLLVIKSKHVLLLVIMSKHVLLSMD